MLKGSKRMRYSGIVEMANSVIVLLYALYWYYSCTTSPDAASVKHSTLIFLAVVVFQLYKLGVSWFATKAAFYSKNAHSMIINGGALTGLSLVWLYFAGSNLHSSLISVLFIVTAAIDIVCSHLFILSAFDNREKVNTVRTFKKSVYWIR